MARCGRYLLLVGLVAAMVPLLSAAPGGGEMVANPYYKFWASSKPGSVVVHKEVSRLGDGKGPDGTDQKWIAYKVLEVTADKVVVEAVVTDEEYFGQVQSAPTKHIYPAKISKATLDRFINETGAKLGEEALKLDGKDYKCKTVTGTIKTGGDETEYKIWTAPEVPGSIVKQVRTTRSQGKLVAETTTTVQSFKAAN